MVLVILLATRFGRYGNNFCVWRIILSPLIGRHPRDFPFCNDHHRGHGRVDSNEGALLVVQMGALLLSMSWLHDVEFYNEMDLRECSLKNHYVFMTLRYIQNTNNFPLGRHYIPLSKWS